MDLDLTSVTVEPGLTSKGPDLMLRTKTFFPLVLDLDLTTVPVDPASRPTL